MTRNVSGRHERLEELSASEFEDVVAYCTEVLGNLALPQFGIPEEDLLIAVFERGD